MSEQEKREQLLDLARAEQNPHAWAEGEIITKEMDVRRSARKLARQIGDQEWRRGNTKYAFEAYEAACVAPSEILEKAEALLKAESLTHAWETQIQNLIEGPVRVEECKTYGDRNLLGYANVLHGSCAYCPADDCSFCSKKKVLNRNYANQVHEALRWDYITPKETKANNLSRNRREVIDDRFSEYYLCSSDKPRQKYRAAAVAALKLVNRLERIYITEKTEEASN